MPAKKMITETKPKSKFSYKYSAIKATRAVVSFPKLSRLPDPFPPRMKRYLTYCTLITLTSATTLSQLGTENVYRLGSLFDPDLTGGTHQPYGFDQMATLYSKYLVRAVSIELSVQNLSNSAMNGCVGVSVQNSSNTLSLTGLALSDCYEKSTNSIIFSPAIGATAFWKSRVTNHFLEGQKPSVYEADLSDYSAAITGNPTLTGFLRIALANNTDTTARTCTVIVRLVYEAEFFDRILLAASN